MKSLSIASMKEISRELISQGIGEVIDAQNIRAYIRKKKGISIKTDDAAYNMEEYIQDEDNTLEALSLSSEKKEALLRELSENKIKEKNLTIDQIDWKKVKTF